MANPRARVGDLDGAFYAGDDGHGAGIPGARLLSRGSDCGDVLRLQEDARFGSTDGTAHLWSTPGDRPDFAADHDLSPAPTCDLWRARPALEQTTKGRVWPRRQHLTTSRFPTMSLSSDSKRW